MSSTREILVLYYSRYGATEALAREICHGVDTVKDAAALWLEDHPKVLQRPIVVDDDRNVAVIGRPPENVLDLLKE